MGVDAQMFVRTRAAGINAEFVRKLSHEACCRFGRKKFTVSRPGTYSWEPEGRHAFSLITEYGQDGDTLAPEPGEAFIEAHLMTRYWGPGYERGDFAFLLVLAEWLELRVPGGQVWYGGDSSGICAAPFDAAKRREFMLHFASLGGDNYHSKRNPFSPREDRPTCDFCKVEMVECMWGPTGTGFLCAGCDLHIVRAPNGSLTQAAGGWPHETCVGCKQARDSWEHHGGLVDGKYWHLTCWARKKLEAEAGR